MEWITKLRDRSFSDSAIRFNQDSSIRPASVHLATVEDENQIESHSITSETQEAMNYDDEVVHHKRDSTFSVNSEVAFAFNSAADIRDDSQLRRMDSDAFSFNSEAASEAVDYQNYIQSESFNMDLFTMGSEDEILPMGGISTTTGSRRSSGDGFTSIRGAASTQQMLLHKHMNIPMHSSKPMRRNPQLTIIGSSTPPRAVAPSSPSSNRSRIPIAISEEGENPRLEIQTSKMSTTTLESGIEPSFWNTSMALSEEMPTTSSEPYNLTTSLPYSDSSHSSFPTSSTAHIDSHSLRDSSDVYLGSSELSAISMLQSRVDSLELDVECAQRREQSSIEEAQKLKIELDVAKKLMTASEVNLIEKATENVSLQCVIRDMESKLLVYEQFVGSVENAKVSAQEMRDSVDLLHEQFLAQKVVVNCTTPNASLVITDSITPIDVDIKLREAEVMLQQLEQRCVEIENTKNEQVRSLQEELITAQNELKSWRIHSALITQKEVSQPDMHAAMTYSNSDVQSNDRVVDSVATGITVREDIAMQTQLLMLEQQVQQLSELNMATELELDLSRKHALTIEHKYSEAVVECEFKNTMLLCREEEYRVLLSTVNAKDEAQVISDTLVSELKEALRNSVASEDSLRMLEETRLNEIERLVLEIARKDLLITEKDDVLFGKDGVIAALCSEVEDKVEVIESLQKQLESAERAYQEQSLVNCEEVNQMRKSFDDSIITATQKLLSVLPDALSDSPLQDDSCTILQARLQAACDRVGSKILLAESVVNQLVEDASAKQLDIAYLQDCKNDADETICDLKDTIEQLQREIDVYHRKYVNAMDNCNDMGNRLSWLESTSDEDCAAFVTERQKTDEIQTKLIEKINEMEAAKEHMQSLHRSDALVIRELQTEISESKDKFEALQLELELCRGQIERVCFEKSGAEELLYASHCDLKEAENHICHLEQSVDAALMDRDQLEDELVELKAQLPLLADQLEYTVSALKEREAEVAELTERVSVLNETESSLAKKDVEIGQFLLLISSLHEQLQCVREDVHSSSDRVINLLGDTHSIQMEREIMQGKLHSAQDTANLAVTTALNATSLSAELEAKCKALEMSKAMDSITLSETRSIVFALTAELEECKETLHIFENADRSRSNSETTDALARLKIFAKECDALRERLTELSDENTALKSNDVQSAALEEAFVEMRYDVESAQLEVQSKTQEIESLLIQQRRLENSIQEKENENADMVAAIQAQSESEVLLIQKINELQAISDQFCHVQEELENSKLQLSEALHLCEVYKYDLATQIEFQFKSEAQLVQNLESLQLEVQSKAQEIESLLTQQRRLENSIQEKENENADMVAAMLVATTQIQVQSESVAQLVERVSELEAVSDQLCYANEDLEKSKQQLSEALDLCEVYKCDLDSALYQAETAKIESKESLCIAHIQIQTLQQDLEACTSDCISLERALCKTHSDLDGALLEAADKTSSFSALFEKLTEVEEANSWLEATVNLKEEQISELCSDLQINADQFKKLSDEYANEITSHSSLFYEYNTAMEQIKELKNEIENLNAYTTDMEVTMEESEDAIEKLRQAVKDLSFQIADARKDVSVRDHFIHELEQHFAKLRDGKKDLRSKMESIAQAVAAKDQLLDDTMAQTEQSTEKLRELESMNVLYTQRIDLLTLASSDYVNEIAKLTDLYELMCVKYTSVVQEHEALRIENQSSLEMIKDLQLALRIQVDQWSAQLLINEESERRHGDLVTKLESEVQMRINEYDYAQHEHAASVRIITETFDEHYRKAEAAYKDDLGHLRSEIVRLQENSNENLSVAVDRGIAALSELRQSQEECNDLRNSNMSLASEARSLQFELMKATDEKTSVEKALKDLEIELAMKLNELDRVEVQHARYIGVNMELQKTLRRQRESVSSSGSAALGRLMISSGTVYSDTILLSRPYNVVDDGTVVSDMSDGGVSDSPRRIENRRLAYGGNGSGTATRVENQREL